MSVYEAIEENRERKEQGIFEKAMDIKRFCQSVKDCPDCFLSGSNNRCKIAEIPEGWNIYADETPEEQFERAKKNLEDRLGINEFKSNLHKTYEDLQIMFGTDATALYFKMKSYEFAKHGVNHGNRLFLRYAEYIDNATDGQDRHSVVLEAEKMREIEELLTDE